MRRPLGTSGSFGVIMGVVGRICGALSVATVIAMSSTGASAQTGASAPADARPVETPRWSDEFVDSIGITTHFHYEQTPYVTKYAAVRDLLTGLGIRHIRDAIVLDAWQPYRDHLSELAKTYGIHTDGVSLIHEPVDQIRAFVSALPNVIESIEGPNEQDLSGGENWAENVAAYQRVLYAGVKGSPLTAALPVIGPSFTSLRAYTETFPHGSFSGLADIGNIHDYFGPFNPGTSGTGAAFPPYGYYGSIAFWRSIAGYIYAPLPIACTETGWDDGATSGPNPATVSAAVKTRYTMRVLLEHWNAGVTRTYLYELLDEGGQNFGNYGLLSGNLDVKPVYTAIKKLVSALSGGNRPQLRPLAYTLSVASGGAFVHHTLLQKSDGTYHLLMWNEVRATDSAVPTQSVTLSFPVRCHKITRVQWQDNGETTSGVVEQSESHTVSLNVSDRVSDIEIQV